MRRTRFDGTETTSKEMISKLASGKTSGDSRSILLKLCALVGYYDSFALLKMLDYLGMYGQRIIHLYEFCGCEPRRTVQAISFMFDQLSSNTITQDDVIAAKDVDDFQNLLADMPSDR